MIPVGTPCLLVGPLPPGLRPAAGRPCTVVAHLPYGNTAADHWVQIAALPYRGPHCYFGTAWVVRRSNLIPLGDPDRADAPEREPAEVLR